MEREVGGGIGMGNTCKPMADSFQCMTESTTIKKKKFNVGLLISTSLVAQTVNCLSTMQETWVRSLGRENSLEKEMITHSSTLA